MKILIVNIYDIDGGAARATYRIHKSLLARGIDSQMLVQRKKSDDTSVESLGTTNLKKIINLLRPSIDRMPLIFYRKRTKALFSTSWLGFNNIVNTINDINPDVVHLHWVCGGMIKIEDLVRIKAPIVWGLLDMWSFTGGCHYNDFCENFKKNCGNCKVLASDKDYDLSRLIYNKKKKIYCQLPNMVIIGHSRWLAESAKQSSLFKGNRILNIPSAIDTTIFKPLNKNISREIFNLPKNKKLILFGAMGATSDPRKGFNELSDSLHKLKGEDIEFVVFGSSKPKNPPNFGFKTHYLGYLNDDIGLANLYSAVDIMVVPSLQENLSNAIIESLACATPVVGFDIGGNSDMIEFKKTGYLAEPFDTTDLKDGIEWVLNADNYDELCANAREKVMKEFDSLVVAKKYIELYEDILKPGIKSEV